MAENNSDLMAEFEEFLNAKKAKQDEDAASEDFEVEIWDEKGRGVRTKRSHAKPFLNSLGIDLDPEPPKEEGTKEDKPKSKPKPTVGSNSSTVRKYFTSGGK